ncbi:MAG: class I SAM-dependent methyltransferase [Acidimicrobiia bacterium]
MAERRTWYHTLDLPDGSVTPGYFDTRAAPAHVPWPEGLRGGRCLDVGTFDGFWAFEMEKRGAREVVAIDVTDPAAIDWPYDRRRWGPQAIREWGSDRGPGFHDAAARLGSAVRHVDRSVYDLDPERDGRFDVVLCGALLLHLRDPVRALEAMREVCSGHLVLVEAIDPALEVRARGVAAASFAPERDEWWRPNSAGLQRLVHVAGFEVTGLGRRFLVPLGPGAPREHRMPLLTGLVAGSPGKRGLVMRAVVARPRPPSELAD